MLIRLFQKYNYQIWFQPSPQSSAERFTCNPGSGSLVGSARSPGSCKTCSSFRFFYNMSCKKYSSFGDLYKIRLETQPPGPLSAMPAAPDLVKHAHSSGFLTTCLVKNTHPSVIFTRSGSKTRPLALCQRCPQTPCRKLRPNTPIKKTDGGFRRSLCFLMHFPI